MPTLLNQRALRLRERMDDPTCNPQKLHNTYAQFPMVNGLVAGWRRVYVQRLRPHLSGQPATLLDIGCGGGDVARRLAQWAQQDGLKLHITAIDPDERALAYARSLPHTPTLSLKQAHSADLVAAGEQFDVVVSPTTCCTTLMTSEVNCPVLGLSTACQKVGLVHNDIRRSDLAYAGYTLDSSFFFITLLSPRTGLLSIRRSFLPEELAEIAPGGWQVEQLFPYRNLLIYQA